MFPAFFNFAKRKTRFQDSRNENWKLDRIFLLHYPSIKFLISFVNIKLVILINSKTTLLDLPIVCGIHIELDNFKTRRLRIN